MTSHHSLSSYMRAHMTYSLAAILLAFALFSEVLHCVPAPGPAVGTFHGLSQPTGVAVDLFGNIFIADSNNSRVIKPNAHGTQQSAFSFNVNLKTPLGVATDTTGYVYVTDTGDNRVVKYDELGNVQAQHGAGSLNNPSGSAIDSQGN